jgi:propanol-preferring alcohol dehydrogenase
MLGKHRDGGYAEAIALPARGAVPLPDEVAFEHGAVLMCSSATSFHALRKARIAAGDTVAVFGLGGLGMSAVQLARAMGALDVYGVDISADKLELAATYGAIPVNAGDGDPVGQIRRMTRGRGVDVALELVGLPETMQHAVRSAAVFGRVALAGIADRPFLVDSYRELIGREAEIIGCSDHLLQELPLLLELVRRGSLDLSGVVTDTIPLDAAAINRTLDRLDAFAAAVRTVIVPGL